MTYIWAVFAISGIVPIAVFWWTRRLSRINPTPEDYSIYYLSEKLNFSRIIDDIYSQFLTGHQINQFYYSSDPNQHGFVVCQTDSGCTFICHLVGTPGQLYVETKLCDWNDMALKTTTQKSMNELRDKIKSLSESFGVYNLGNNDCRHFAKSLKSFLES
jgi:hypothetical protein